MRNAWTMLAASKRYETEYVSFVSVSESLDTNAGMRLSQSAFNSTLLIEEEYAG